MGSMWACVLLCAWGVVVSAEPADAAVPAVPARDFAQETSAPAMIPVTTYVEPNTVPHPDTPKKVYEDPGDYTVLPAFERTREEEAAWIRNSTKPQMVEAGHFEADLCKKYLNCTKEPMHDEQAAPHWAPPGSLTKARRHEMEARMKEALLMRWSTVTAEVLSNLEQQRQVCKIISNLQPIADFVISSGTSKDLTHATTLFALVCPKVKEVFPLPTKNLNCNNLHARTLEYHEKRSGRKLPHRGDPKEDVFDIGSCCNCTSMSGRYEELQAQLDNEHSKLKREVDEGRERQAMQRPPITTVPEIVDKLHTAGVRVYLPSELDAQPKTGDGLRMKAISEETIKRPTGLRHGAKMEQEVIQPDLYASYAEGHRIAASVPESRHVDVAAQLRGTDAVAEAEVEALRVEADRLDKEFEQEAASFESDVAPAA